MAEAAPRRWKQLLSLVRGWSWNLAPALALALVWGCSLYGQSVIATMSAHEISSITSKAGLANVNNYTVPLLSRNGNRIAFLLNDPTVAFTADVMVINSDGTGQSQLATAVPCCLLDISDDGSLVAYGTPQGQLVLAAADGSSNHTLVQLGGGYLFAPRISADNSKLFFVVSGDNSLAGSGTAVPRGVYSIGTNGTGLRQIISGSAVATALGLTAAQVPAFGNALDRSTDGTRIVFGVTGTPTGTAILSANTNGTGILPVVKNVQIVNWLSLSGDGTKIAYNLHLNPFPQPNQIVATNLDGSGAMTLATNFNDDGYPMQLSSDGSQLLVGSAGRLYRTDGSGFLLLSALGVFDELSGDPPTILTNGTLGGTMNSAGSRIEYLANDANNVSQIIIMDIRPSSIGAAPVISNPGVSPDYVLINNLSSATETVHVTPTTATLYRVSSVTLTGGVADTGSGGTVFEGVLYDDGTHGDAVKGDGTFTNNGVTADSIAVTGGRVIMYRAEATASGGKRHASELQLSPFSVLKTAPYTYTVAASTPGLTVVVDGIPYLAPQQFLWDTGDSHTLNVPSPQTLSGNTYAFSSWSDNGAQSHVIDTIGVNTTYTAIFGVNCGKSSFTATFTTSLGTLTVTQNPDCTLTGAIPLGATFLGAAPGSVWTGTFTGPSGSGTFSFTLGSGGISGSYNYSSGTGTSGTLTTDQATAMSANEIGSIPAKAALANVNNGTVPMISRDGSRIAFVTNDPNISGNVDVSVINSDGTGQRQLASTSSCCLLDISDDGSLVAYGATCCRPTQLGLASADGSNNRNVVSLQGGYFYSPRISADNSKVFFAVDRDTALADNTPITRGVWSIGTNGTGLHQVVTAATAAAALGLTAAQVPYFGYGLDRSTDGTRIVFSVAATPTGTALLAANADGTQIHPILQNVQYLNNLSLSGDGTKIAYNLHLNPFPQPNQIVVTNFDGSGAVTLATNFNDDGYPMQLSADGSQLLVGTAGRLYRTDGSGWVLLSAQGPFDEISGDPPTILGIGTFGGTLNAAGNRLEYLANDANNVSQIIVMDINPTSTGAAPVISNPGVSPDFVLLNNLSSATETVHVTSTTATLYRVSSVTLTGGVADTGSGGTVFEGVLYDDGTHGDAVKGDGTFTNNGVTADSIAVTGGRVVMFRAEAAGSDGKRHASELQYVPFSVLKTAPFTYTINTNPPGMAVVVDGTTFTTPQKFLWDGGDSHILGAASPQTFSGMTYTFNNWSDNGAQSHTITVPAANTTYTAALLTNDGGKCDINRDGFPNVTDVQHIINEALGLIAAVDDLTGAGTVNVVDVQSVINYVLGLGCTAI